MDIAIIGTSKKENERRVPIHPDHIIHIPLEIRKHMFFESGYGIPFGMDDETIFALTGNALNSREDLFKKFKAIIITKPIEEDFESMQDGTLVWGWIHSVQQSTIAQIAIDKKLTLIAWENMNYQSKRERIHIFNKNNEMAGYCGTQHALELLGIDGQYGPRRRVSVISLGSASRGAIFALKGHGFSDITVYTQRPSFLVGDKIPGVQYKQIVKDKNNKLMTVSLLKEKKPFLDDLIDSDVIINGTLQNINSPIDFILNSDIDKFKKRCLIVDISCDEGMGFSFAIPTTFEEPIIDIGKIKYYSVDHTPSLLWNSASWEISKCILPYLQFVVNGKDNAILNNAIDIKDGIIVNKEILTYQNRSLEVPYEVSKTKKAKN